ncbi:MAG: pilus assembly protein TadG-related protein [Hyphomonadaceae bacterium]
MRAIARVFTFWFDRRGLTAIVTALSLPTIIGAAGLGVEVGYWFFEERRLQTAADLAANAGAVMLRSGARESEVDATALREATKNGFDEAIGAITVNTPPTTGAHRNNRAVEVLLETSAPRYFTSLFSQSPVIIRVRAVAAYENEQQACILALDTWANDAVIFIGNPTAEFEGCVVMSNSLADDSITIAGSADVTAPCIVSAGGTAVSADLTLTSCAAPMEEMPQAVDPYEDLPEPSMAGACTSVPNGNPNLPKTISAGRYCGGLNLSGQVTLNPGVYIVDGGEFRINSNAVVNGVGVTFFLTNGATVHFNGSAEINFSAPTSGAYAGVLMYGDRDEGNDENVFNGTADSRMTGALYFPTQQVTYNGNFSGDNGCLRIVSRAIDLRGNADFGADCTGTGLDAIQVPGAVRLVE